LLKIISIEGIKKFSVEFDVYVPCKIRFGSWDMSKEHTLYWRMGDFEKSLIEIGIGSMTGILRSFTLTEAGKIIEKNDSFLNINCKIYEGIPVFSTEDFPSNGFKDYINQFEVLLGQNNVTISIRKNVFPNKLISLDRILFGVDKDDYLSFLTLSQINSNEMKVLREGLNYN
jgi:hypothetical protein